MLRCGAEARIERPQSRFKSSMLYDILKGTVLGTPTREPQEYSRNIMEYNDPGRYIPIIYLLYSWGSRFGVPSRVPLMLLWPHDGQLSNTLTQNHPKIS